MAVGIVQVGKIQPRLRQPAVCHGTQVDAVAACLLERGGADRMEGVVLARAPCRNRAQLAGL